MNTVSHLLAAGAAVAAQLAAIAAGAAAPGAHPAVAAQGVRHVLAVPVAQAHFAAQENVALSGDVCCSYGHSTGNVHVD